MPDYSDTRIQLRIGSAAQWASANTVLGEGEPGFSINDNTLKIGDGVTTYANLSGISGGGGGGGSSTFLGLNDTPANFTSASSKFLKVNSSGNALEFVAASPLENVLEDETPQLGGTLDLNGNNVTGVGDFNYIYGSGNFTEGVFASGSPLVKSDTTSVANASGISNIVAMTASQYTALSSYDPETLYYIIG